MAAALSLVRRHRPAACPNDGFLEQLRLFESMGFRVDASSKAFKCYKLRCIQNQILRTKILPSEVRAYREGDPDAPQPIMTQQRRTMASANKIRYVKELGVLSRSSFVLWAAFGNFFAAAVVTNDGCSSNVQRQIDCVLQSERVSE